MQPLGGTTAETVRLRLYINPFVFSYISVCLAAATDAKASQTALTLNPAVIQTTDDGQNPPVTGQTAAATSPNNFANFCALGLPKTPITNGLQTTTGSCNPIPIGQIPGTNAIPSAKFQSPTNGDTIAADKAFTITLAAKNIQLGTFTNAQKTYFANPQTLNGQGQIIGHTHVVIEAIDSLGSTKVTDPTKFFFFKGVDAPANGQGQVTVDVTTGVPAGTYRMGTIMSSATHQPVIVPIAQHGLCDDVVYVSRLRYLCFPGLNAPCSVHGYRWGRRRWWKQRW
ncbi:hypothetical protein C8R43DRAFT_874726 [Mycena crocata]|nr:hypothetical protein C8R43DRAFT_874726 [Mycena crocata]